MLEQEWQNILADDLDKLSQIISPVKEKTVKLEEGENRIVSIFFLDIKGFTSISEKLHPEEVKRIIDKIFTVFTNVILKYGGYIDKYEGDLIMALFGSKQTSETDTERAIRSGLEILNKLKQINEMLKPKNIELGVRIGINTGLVTTGKIGLGRAGDFTVYGDPVNLASRMESNAPINSIMIPLETKNLVPDIFQFEGLGKIEVKGKSQPVEVYKVVGIAPRKVERWERSKLIQKPEYVGRDKELNKIENLYKKTKSQIGKIDPDYKPKVIGLRSPAGLGKSRLIYEFSKKIKKKHKLNNLKNIKISGYTKSYAQAPYTLWTSLIKNYVGINETDTKEIIRDKFENSYSQISNELTRNEKQNFEKAKPILGFILGLAYEDIRLKKPDLKSLQVEIFLAIRYFLEAITKIANKQKYPMIIILEDVHWIDESSLNAFKTILSSLNVEEKRDNKPDKNMFFLLTYRNEFELLREFEFRTRFTEFKLKPLNEDNYEQMIKSMIGTLSFPTKLKTELMKKCEGNPFYIEEWIHSLIDDEIIKYENGKWNIKGDIDKVYVPSTLNNLILSRIDKMEEKLRNLLQKASVIGNSFLQPVLEAIEKKLGSKEHLQIKLSELINLDWLIEEKKIDETTVQYLFKHIIACDVAYQTTLQYNKKIIHKIIAEFVEEKFKDNREYYFFLANHYEKAEVIEKTIEYLEKAGDYAKENYQNENAIELYNKLLDLLDGNQTDKIIDVLHNKYEILRLIGKWKESEIIIKETISLSEKIKDKKRIGKSNGLLGQQFWITENYDKAIKYHEKCLKISEEIKYKNGISNANGGLGLVYSDKGDYDKAMEYYKKHLKLSEELGDRKRISGTFINMGIVFKRKCDYEEAMKFYKKGLKIAEDIGHKEWIANATSGIGNIYKIKGDYNKAMECYEKFLKISEGSGHKIGIAAAAGNMGNLYYNQGNYKKAMECYNKYLKISEELGDKKRISFAVGNIGNVYADQCNYKKAMEYYEKLLKISEELGTKIGISAAFGNMGIIYKDKGDYNKAMECYKKQLKINEDLGNKRGISLAVGNMGVVYEDQGNYTKAMECYEKALTIAKEIGVKWLLPHWLSGKSEMLYRMEKNEDAKKNNEECLKIAEEIKDEEHIFDCKVRDAKIEFKKIKNYEFKIKNCIEPLEKMLLETKEEKQIATLNYELGIMNKELKRNTISNQYKKEALRLYKKLYKKTPNIEYKNRIKELEEK